MEKNVPKKTGANGAPFDKEAEQDLKKVDLVIAGLMSTSALVSGWLSFQGASAIFGDGMTALGFTVVVQGAVSLALWRFAVTRGLQRFLLSAAWAVAVTFSIGTAYVNVDKQNNTAGTVAGAGIEINAVETAIEEKIQQAFAAAANKNQEAAIEAQNGGCGPICEGLQQEAETLQAQAEHLRSSVGNAISKSADGRANADTLPEMLEVYQELKTEAAGLMAGIQEPAFIANTQPSSFDRVADAMNRLFSADGSMDVATMGALWVACLMELLALASAMIRMALYMKPSDDSLETRFEKTLAWVYDLRTLPNRVATLAKRRADEWLKKNKQRVSTRGKTGKRTAGSIKSDQEYWTEGLFLQSQTSDASMIDLITELVEGQATVTVQAKIDGKIFEKTPGITNVLINTGVLKVAKNDLVAGEKWGEWNTFLLEEYRRQRTQNTAAKKPHLRNVA